MNARDSGEMMSPFVIFSRSSIKKQSTPERVTRWTMLIASVVFVFMILVLQGSAFKVSPNESEYVAAAPTWSTEMVAWAFVGVFWAISSSLVALHYSFSAVIWTFVMNAFLFGLIISEQWLRTTNNNQEETVVVLVWTLGLAMAALPSLLLSPTSKSPNSFINAIASTSYMPLIVYVLYLFAVQLMDANVTQTTSG